MTTPMYAAVLHTLGKPPCVDQFPEPVPGEGEVVVHVHAASLKPVDKQLASGSHYASPRVLPAVCGIDGVGHLDDGQRVFFAGVRPPYGAMAQRAVLSRAFVFPLPDGVDDDIAAALPNPGVSAWLSLAFRAKLAAGENVLILGATGVTGKLAIQIAKLLGAGRVVAAARNPSALETLHRLGADAAIRLDASSGELAEARLAFKLSSIIYGVRPPKPLWVLSHARSLLRSNRKSVTFKLERALDRLSPFRPPFCVAPP